MQMRLLSSRSTASGNGMGVRGDRPFGIKRPPESRLCPKTTRCSEARFAARKLVAPHRNSGSPLPKCSCGPRRAYGESAAQPPRRRLNGPERHNLPRATLTVDHSR